MLQRFKNEDEGFTLIELLVVILIVGILAAIALPTFLGQQKKGQDTAAKTDARNLVTHVESCYADTQDYTACGTSAMSNTGLDLGSTAGKVEVATTGAGTYKVTAYSKSTNTFSITRNTDGTVSRTCTTGASGSGGGCKTGNTW